MLRADPVLRAGRGGPSRAGEGADLLLTASQEAQLPPQRRGQDVLAWADWKDPGGQHCDVSSALFKTAAGVVPVDATPNCPRDKGKLPDPRRTYRWRTTSRPTVDPPGSTSQ